MLLSLLLSAAVVGPVQEVSPTQSPDTTRLKPVIVRDAAVRSHHYSAARSATAAKVNLPLRDTPQSVSVITSTLIAEQSMQSLADAVRYVPGVTMGQGEGHRDAPTIRGNSSTADFYVDGIRDDAQYFRDFYNMDRLEVLAGSNAMTFGRGGGGGVINRVTKRANWQRTRDLSLEGGSFAHGRGTLDYGGALSDAFAARVNAMYQRSNGFRDAFVLSRFGVAPSVAWQVSGRTVASVGAEYFQDRRRVDRGMPSYQGRPSGAALDVFFGNPDSSYASAEVGSLDAGVQHAFSDAVQLRSLVRGTAYDKFYQNVLPGAVTSPGTEVSLLAYSNDMQRENVFAQNELTVRVPGAPVSHTVLVGVELGRQDTDNLRRTGYFNGTSTSITVPFDAPTVATPLEFRQSPSDANNNTVANVVSVYAQDVVALASRFDAMFGVRVERFALDYRDHRTTERLSRSDDLFSPRVGVVFRPAAPLSLYSSYSVSHLPSAGDQFSGLTVTQRTLEPERFATYEAGAKWEPRAQLAITAAAYELLRTNSAAPSALDPGVIVQTGKQRTRGVELTVSGSPARHWDVVGAAVAQSAKIVSATAAAPAGRTVPLVPNRTFSLWNRFQVSPRLGLGLGVVTQSTMYAAIDNAVTLPGFSRLDAAAFVGPFQHVKLQLNVENALDRRYYATSHGNNNIMPGAPRTVRVSVSTTLR